MITFKGVVELNRLFNKNMKLPYNYTKEFSEYIRIKRVEVSKNKGNDDQLKFAENVALLLGVKYEKKMS